MDSLLSDYINQINHSLGENKLDNSHLSLELCIQTGEVADLILNNRYRCMPEASIYVKELRDIFHCLALIYQNNNIAFDFNSYQKFKKNEFVHYEVLKEKSYSLLMNCSKLAQVLKNNKLNESRNILKYLSQVNDLWFDLVANSNLDWSKVISDNHYQSSKLAA